MSPHLILKHLISSVVSLAQLISPSVALPAKLVFFLGSFLSYKLNHHQTYVWESLDGKAKFAHRGKFTIFAFYTTNAWPCNKPNMALYCTLSFSNLLQAVHSFSDPLNTLEDLCSRNPHWPLWALKGTLIFILYGALIALNIKASKIFLNTVLATVVQNSGIDDPNGPSWSDDHGP